MMKTAAEAHLNSVGSYENHSARHWWEPLNPPIAGWRGANVWLVGASTGIGRATAQVLHHAGARVAVSARKAGELEAFVRDHPGALALPMDALDRDAVRAAARQVLARGRLDLVVYCAGHYREQRATAFDLAEMVRHNDINYVGALNLLDAVLPALLAQGGGHLSLVSSVAGYRGLPRALAYGSTKAALTHFAEALHLELAPQGLGISVVTPGFVETPMTAVNDFAMPAMISPAQAADAIIDGWRRGRFMIDFPLRFTRLLALLRCLPYALYFPLVRRLTRR